MGILIFSGLTFSTFFFYVMYVYRSFKGEMFKVKDGKKGVHFVPISGAQNISKFSKWFQMLAFKQNLRDSDKNNKPQKFYFFPL